MVLGPETWPEWLGEAPADARQLKPMLAPYPSEEMACWPVSTRVGNVKKRPEPDRADCFGVIERRCGSQRPVILCVPYPEPELSNQCPKPKLQKRYSCLT